MAEEGLTSLLFTLPAEIRDMIYDLVLPHFPPHLKLTRRCDGLQWLATSRAIFLEAGARFYSNTCFYDCSALGAPSDMPLAKALACHVQSSYGCGSQRNTTLAGALVKQLVVDLRIVRGYSLEKGLKWYFHGIRDVFPNLSKLFVYFGPTYMVRDPGLVHLRHDFIKFKQNSYDPESLALQNPFQEPLDTIAKLAPPDCVIRWQAFGRWIKRGS